jgi:undecaprenyl-diphosphatase
MNAIQAIILGIIQGLTEFIPVSSSGHLVLVPWALGWPSPGLLFDTMLHWGTLAAVLIYFWRDWVDIIRGFFRSLFTSGPWNAEPGGRLANPDNRLAWAVIIGTIPAVILGLLFKDAVEAILNTPAAVGAGMVITALILTLAERFGQRDRPLTKINLLDALLIGLAQGIAIVPGISRSGATISAGMGLRMTRDGAARYSFLLATPAILGAGLLQLFEVMKGAEPVTTPILAIVLGTLSAAVVGYLCIRFLLAYLRRGKLYPFAIYCLVVGLIVIVATLR